MQARDVEAAHVLAAPVATWGAWPFYRAATINARHGAATMDTLVSLGVAAAGLWSVYALCFGGATYLEVAAAVTHSPVTTPCTGSTPLFAPLVRRTFHA